MFDVKSYKSELEKICDFTEIYEKFRLVDPVTKSIYTLANGKAVHSGDEHCYKIWNRDTPCENCVSLRTCHDRAQYFKLENLSESILMVVSRPVLVEEKLFSLELVTDVTGSMIVQQEGNHKQTSIAALISEVNRLSVSDVFTGLYNNNFIKNRILELTRSNLLYPFSLLVIDIDQFKLVNDQYGHMSGDVVIQKIAAELSTFSTRPGCYVGRMGGDEYCVVLENCTRSEAEISAQQIAKKIQMHHYEGNGQTFTVDVSIGIGEYNSDEDAYAFVDRVDRSLYEAKHIKAAMTAGTTSPR